MNGRKYKVTVRVVDHPPRYCDLWKAQQKKSGIGRDENNAGLHSQTITSKPVYKSCVTLDLSHGKNKTDVDKLASDTTGTDHLCQTSEVNCRTADSSYEGMCQPDTSNLTHPSDCNDKRFGAKRTGSLNIYKLTRSNAIDQDCFEETSSAPGDIKDAASDANVPSKDTCDKPDTTLNLPKRLLYSNKGRYGVGTRMNGCNVDVPIVVLNSVQESGRFKRNIIPLNSAVNDAMTDGLGSADCFLADSTRRPRFDREGSACSSDSIITEIEGLTDEDEEVCAKMTQEETDGDREEECAPKCNNNWKKIRGMIHWTPFAKNYKKKYPWVQLAGHQGNFKAGEEGTILKKTNGVEKGCLIQLMKDVLRPYVPEFKREVKSHDEYYLVMQDLLLGFDSPSVMDCKMGVRTFLEDELEKARLQPKLRKDLYQKMVDTDPSAPTEEERKAGGILKPRYMKWREDLSSSSTLGFRIEGIKKCDEKPNKDFKTTRSREEVGQRFRDFIDDDVDVKMKYLQRLKAIRGMLEASIFFKNHEVIGSSLLFVHDYRGNVNVWMIDFAKTVKVENGIQLTHRAKWTEGNHEDGYLFGLDNMISIWSSI